MTHDWQTIWNRRGCTDDSPHDLQRLLEIDGFDSGAGRIADKDFREYVGAIAERLEIADGSSIYEIGCGAGALLFGLCEQYDLRVGGCDYAPTLIDFVRRLFPLGEFAVAEANNAPKVPKYDFVVARSVFHYFPNLDYAHCVVESMIAKANSAVAVLDIPHERTRAEAESLRRDRLTKELYEEKYRGLEHLYYVPLWFGEIAKEAGFDFEYFDPPVDNYAQSRFRFDLVIRKRR